MLPAPRRRGVNQLSCRKKGAGLPGEEVCDQLSEEATLRRFLSAQLVS